MAKLSVKKVSKKKKIKKSHEIKVEVFDKKGKLVRSSVHGGKIK